MDYTKNNSCEDINQIRLDNLIENEGNTLNYSSEKQLNGTDDFADEYEKTREYTRQNLEQLDKHLKTIFKEPILNQETQLGKKKDIEQIILNNLTDEEGNIPYILTDEEDPYYLRGEPIYESNFADETETRDMTRQLLNNLEQHLNNLFKEPILNQETQLGKKKQRKKSGRKTKDDKSTGKKHD